MNIGIPLETFQGEKRVAITPHIVPSYIKAQHRIQVQSHAGESAHFSDEDYQKAGAEIVNQATVYQNELILKVRRPQENEIKLLLPKSVLIGMLEPHTKAGLESLAQSQTTAFALELAPRTTRAQSMDVLSSQATVSGYLAVILAARALGKFFPMLTTAAGTIKATKVVVLGVGVAGLQAIATAKRLGAVVEASDVRPSVKEQVLSLGAKFIEVPYTSDEERDAAAGVGGYAKPMPVSWLNRQKLEVAKHIAQANVVISTALIPGRDAPKLISEDMVKQMSMGSVIVDLAASQGGNCELTEPGCEIIRHGVRILGETNIPSLMPTDASQLYARNLYDFVRLLSDAQGQLLINSADDIVQACLLCQNGHLLK
ncbi:MAG: Re/Si-specific NAD(P)(+) transhydrogenase subunit alpha [Gammaproteobacteria bacterium]|nr:Re/Si-specific NAD(P)(+) transhydrogenase subunit alpha [Gammaproteobacteria bacterium]